MTSEGFAQSWIDFEKEMGFRPLLRGNLEEMGESFGEIGAAMVEKYPPLPGPDSSIKVEDRTIEDGLRIRIYTPVDYSGNKPVGVYYHGGGWAMGDIDGDDASCRSIAKAGVVLVSIEYGLAPQNKHPGLINDCWKGFQWTLKNAESLGGLGGRIFTAGVSAGGQLALGLALKALDEGLDDALVGVVALVPATVHPEGVPDNLKFKWNSYKEHANHTVNTDEAMLTFWDAFGPPPTDPVASPLLHTKINGLQRVYLAVAGHDTLRDDGLLFKQKLDDAGVPNKLDFYKGYPHYHWTWPSRKLDEARNEFNANLVQGVRFVVSK